MAATGGTTLNSTVRANGVEPGCWLKKKAPDALDRLDCAVNVKSGSRVVAEAAFAVGSVGTPPSTGVPYIQGLAMEPAIRIERTTCGLRMAKRLFYEGSVFQLVSPFL
jgi:hypothetical protein